MATGESRAGARGGCEHVVAELAGALKPTRGDAPRGYRAIARSVAKEWWSKVVFAADAQVVSDVDAEQHEVGMEREGLLLE